jgi:Protein of unknown function (DUF4229)
MSDELSHPAEPTRARQRFGLARYTVIRLALFAVVTAVLWLVGVRANLFLLLALGLVLSGFISLFALDRSRDAASTSVTGAFGRMNQRIEASARAEDGPSPDSPRVED